MSTNWDKVMEMGESQQDEMFAMLGGLSTTCCPEMPVQNICTGLDCSDCPFRELQNTAKRLRGEMLTARAEKNRLDREQKKIAKEIDEWDREQKAERSRLRICVAIESLVAEGADPLDVAQRMQAQS